MQSICNAAQSWKVKKIAQSFSGLTLSALNPDFGATPQCLSGGMYTFALTGTELDSKGNTDTIPTNGIGLSCSYSGHNGFIAALMSQ